MTATVTLTHNGRTYEATGATRNEALNNLAQEAERTARERDRTHERGNYRLEWVEGVDFTLTPIDLLAHRKAGRTWRSMAFWHLADGMAEQDRLYAEDQENQQREITNAENRAWGRY